MQGIQAPLKGWPGGEEERKENRIDAASSDAEIEKQRVELTHAVTEIMNHHEAHAHRHLLKQEETTSRMASMSKVRKLGNLFERVPS